MENLTQSSGAQPIEKTIMIHAFEKSEKKYCLRFQNGSCRFGKACIIKNYKKIDPNYKKTIPEERKEIKNDY